MRAALWVMILASSFAAGCGDAEPALFVDLRTDWVPGLDFTLVEVVLTPSGSVSRMESRVVTTGDSTFPEALRVAEMSGVPARPSSVLVRISSRSGVVGEARADVTIQGRTGVIVVITRSCAGVSCPGADPSATTCWGGRCVPPTCGPRNVAACGPPECESDATCTASPECGTGRCVDGICFAARDDSRCSAGEVCDPANGCVGAPPEDGGALDGGPDGGPLTPLAREDFVRDAKSRLCELAVECHERLGAYSAILDEACHPTFSAQSHFFEVGARTGYDEVAARACLAALEAIDDCVFAAELPPVCFDALPGELPDGSACAADSDCASAVCSRLSNSCSVGTCAIAVGAGDACDGLSFCEPALRCIDGTCGRWPAAGEPCGPRGACGAGLVCETGTCRRGPLLGEACSLGGLGLGIDPCVGGNRCNGATCITPALAGAPCSAQLCEGGTRCDGSYCRQVALPGELCATDEDCPDVFFLCADRTCVPKAALGGACTETSDCIQGLCDAMTCRLGRGGEACRIGTGLRMCEGPCDASVRTCVDPGALTEACLPMAWACGDDAYCSSSGACSRCP